MALYELQNNRQIASNCVLMQFQICCKRQNDVFDTQQLSITVLIILMAKAFNPEEELRVIAEVFRTN